MIPVTPRIAIDEDAIEEVFVRAGGPGGQNVNKVARGSAASTRRVASLDAPSRGDCAGLPGGGRRPMVPSSSWRGASARRSAIARMHTSG
jgi:hypothetical protein